MSIIYLVCLLITTVAVEPFLFVNSSSLAKPDMSSLFRILTLNAFQLNYLPRLIGLDLNLGTRLAEPPSLLDSWDQSPSRPRLEKQSSRTILILATTDRAFFVGVYIRIVQAFLSPF